MSLTNKLTAVNQLLKYCQKSPFYRDRIPLKPLKSLEEFKQIPFTTKEDLRVNSPFGLVCVNKKELYEYHESFGTTGTPISTWLTKKDMENNIKNINSGGINFSKEDLVLIRFPYAISLIAHMVHQAVQAKGGCVIAASSRTSITPFTRCIDLIKKLQVTVLAGLPLQALLLAETAELMGFNPQEDFPYLRAIFAAGEPLTIGKRKLLEDIWGVPVTDNFGMTEIGSALTSCPYGRCHPPQDQFFFEVLDESLTKDVDEGQTGNLVITSLKSKGTPVIRYLTGDRAKIIAEKCPCGQTLTFQHHGRKDNIISIGNQVLDIWDFDEIISHLPCRRFWIVGTTPAGVKFVIEEEGTVKKIETNQIKQLEEKYGFEIEVELVPQGTLYDSSELFTVAEVGKPRYIYSQEEMEQKAYLKLAKL